MDKKYLKYKTKYLQLQQDGGFSEAIDVLSTVSAAGASLPNIAAVTAATKHAVNNAPKKLSKALGYSSRLATTAAKTATKTATGMAKASQKIVEKAVDGAEAVMKKVATGAQNIQNSAELELIIKILKKLKKLYKTPDSHLNKSSSNTHKDAIKTLLMEIYDIINKEMNLSVTDAIKKVSK